MTVLAIDPGLAFTACVLVSDEGELLDKLTIKLGGKMDPDDRIEKLQKELDDFVTSECGLESVAVIEGFAMYGLKGAVVNAFQMGRVVQAIIDVVYDRQLAHDYLPAREARTYITGNHAAKSAQIKAGLELLGHKEKSNEHERDALALALTWLAKQREKEAV